MPASVACNALHHPLDDPTRTSHTLLQATLSVLTGESCCAADDAVARLAKETGHPERLAGLAVDISNAKSVEAAAQTLERDFAGKLGGLINNAAVSQRVS